VIAFKSQLKINKQGVLAQYQGIKFFPFMIASLVQGAAIKGERK